jgi:transglutaminase-like putative cysteine protease/tetratricopeptide (TPR) repeat protein
MNHRPRRRPVPRSLLLLVACAAVCLSLAPAFGAGDAEGCFEQWWQQRLAGARDAADEAEALVAVFQVADLARTARAPALVYDALERVRSAPHAHPLVAAEVERILLEQDRARGTDAQAAERRRRLGLIEEFWIAGPFTEPAEALAAATDPVTAADGGTRWRRQGVDPGGVVPFHVLMTPAEKVGATALFHLRAAKRTSIVLRFGADDAARVIVDGRTVFEPDHRHAFAHDQHAVLLHLEPGLHRVAFALEQETDVFLLSARLTAPDGGPAAGVEVVATEGPGGGSAPLAGLASARRWKRRAEAATIPAMLEQAQRRGDAAAQAALALDLHLRGHEGRDSNRALTLARAAAAAAPADPAVQWVAAAVETDRARERVALERMLTFWPEHPAALRRLALYYLDVRRLDEVEAVARRASAACAGSDPWLDGLIARAAYERAFPLGSLAAMERQFEAAPGQPMLAASVADLCAREGLTGRALRAYRRTLALDRTDRDARRALFELLVRSGQRAEALDLLEQATEVEPFEPEWRLRLSRTLLADGDAERALAVAERALELSPGHPGLLIARGEAQLAGGRAGSAAESWQQALDTSGDEAGLAKRIASATGEDDTFATRWTVPIAEALEIEKAQPLDEPAPVVVLSRTDAYRIAPSGLGTRFHQVIQRVRDADRAQPARVFSFTWSPTLERAKVLEARLVRSDGTIVPAARRERPLLPDPELRMWYDTRVQTLGFPRLENGDLIEVRYVTTDRGPGNPLGDGYFGEVQPYGGAAPVLSARLVLDAPDERPLRHVLVHVDEPAVVLEQRDAGRTVQVVELPRLAAAADAPAAPAPTHRLPYAVVGSVASWEQLGAMYADLIEEQLRMTPDVREAVRTVTAGVRDEREKVRRLYEWVIENTRYIALELGIHALKPYSVASVFERRHGDCKDKASLLVAMLHEAGIEARIGVIRTSERGPIDTRIPTFAAFNHVIVYVPGQDLWLDGTVLHHAAGELPAPDRGRPVLLVDPLGGTPAALVTSPAQAPDHDVFEQVERIEVQRDGAAEVAVEVVARGEAAARERTYFRQQDRPGAVLLGRLRQLWADFELDQASFPAVSLQNDPVRYRYRGRIEHFGRVAGERLSFPLAMMLPGLAAHVPSPGRQLPLELPPAQRRRVELDLVFPRGAAVVELPPRGNIESPWGRITVAVDRNRQGARVIVESELGGGIVPVERLDELRRFLVEARQALDGRIVLRLGGAS